ncbi:MAG: T9SS type A sorting domain-containing protein [Flavobacteriales bacterium]|nr:T9SS type A sorting domain-containing protein [Flavobacteriales bacterium]
MSISKSILSLTLCLIISFVLQAQNNSCLVQQVWGPDSFILKEGNISQTFEPCSNGQLNYLNLKLGSMSDVSFATRMNISKFTRSGQELLCTQQMVIPGSDREPAVNVWLTSPVELEAGERYIITIEGNKDHSIQVKYSPQDDYSNGSILKNGQREKGDLAFELGIMHNQAEHRPSKAMFSITPASDPCSLSNKRKDCDLDAKTHEWSQSFSPCEEVNLKAFAILASSSQDKMGQFSVHQKNLQGKWQIIFQQEMLLNVGDETWSQWVLQEELILQKNTEYRFKVDLNNPWGVSYFGTRSDAIKNGKYEGAGKIKDLAFQLNPFQAALPEFIDEEGDCALVNDISPVSRASQNELISISFIACEFGELNRIQLPVVLRENQNFSWFIRDKQEYILGEGEVHSSDITNGIAIIEPQNVQLVEGLEYDLILISNEMETVKFYLAQPDTPEIWEIRSDTDELILPLALKIEMKSEVIDFIEAQDQSLLKSNIYPNPFTQQFTLRLEGDYTGTIKIGVYDFRGNEVQHLVVEKQDLISENKVTFDHNFDPGYYTLRIECGSEVYLETLIKE